ncbi:MAG: PSD1 and planctomycete cytochrome C domain-containing protein [Pirellula sp.]
MPTPPKIVPYLFLALAVVLNTWGRADDPRLTERTAQFEREIRPVLVSQCIKCHGEKKQEGGLRLDSRKGLLQGGDSGAAVVAGKPEESLLIEAIHHRGLEMPPTGKLPNKVLLHFERWIAGGATWPDSVKSLRESDGNISEADREWWAFLPISKHEAPNDDRDHWSRTDIDRFIWKALADKELQPAPQADKATLGRRLYLDLVGVPPSPTELDAFVRDESTTAYESMVDRLLEDPRYGEHWARFWLDLVRYSESDGWNQDAYRPNLWRFRDYVVNAFNRDMPFPQFVKDQLAGDESADGNPDGLVAAGFLRLGVYEYNQRDARGQWNDIMNETTDVVGDVFFGLSIACARCHQHKFDPIPQRDYFKLRAFFEPLCWRDDLVAATEEQKSQYQEKLSIWEKETQSIRSQIAELLEPYEVQKWKSTVDKFPLDIQACFHMPTTERTSRQEQMAYLVSRQYLEEGGGPYKSMKKEDTAKHEALLKELSRFDHLKPSPLPEAMTVCDFDGLVSPTVNPDDRRRQPIAHGFLEVLSDNLELNNANAPGEDVRPGTTGRRTALAQWIGNPRNPLTHRVFVNRIWQRHFGQGLVATSNDFGHLGDSPTHPELLDWLTATFVESGWQMKKLHKVIVMSAAWQQSAHHPNAPHQQTVDPAERLLWRARVHRLHAEQIRDSMLLASGELTTSIGGPSIAEDSPRRSLYVKSFRNQNDTFLHGFDVANGLQSVAVRDTTTTPTQSLLLLNGKFSLARADRLAERLLAETALPIQAVRNAFRWVWGKEPTPIELERAIQFVGLTHGEDEQVLDRKKLADFCHVLFNSNQFLYVE